MKRGIKIDPVNMPHITKIVRIEIMPATGWSYSAFIAKRHGLERCVIVRRWTLALW